MARSGNRTDREPDLPIIDPHHHLWPDGGALPYDIDTLAADTGSGDNVVATVFIECHVAYRPDGPRHLKPFAESEFVTAQAAALAGQHPEAAPISGTARRIYRL